MIRIFPFIVFKEICYCFFSTIVSCEYTELYCILIFQIIMVNLHDVPNFHLWSISFTRQFNHVSRSQTGLFDMQHLSYKINFLMLFVVPISLSHHITPLYCHAPILHLLSFLLMVSFTLV